MCISAGISKVGSPNCLLLIVADSSSYFSLFIYFSANGERSTIEYKHLSDPYGISQFICGVFFYNIKCMQIYIFDNILLNN